MINYLKSVKCKIYEIGFTTCSKLVNDIVNLRSHRGGHRGEQVCVQFWWLLIQWLTLFLLEYILSHLGVKLPLRNYNSFNFILSTEVYMKLLLTLFRLCLLILSFFDFSGSNFVIYIVEKYPEYFVINYDKVKISWSFFYFLGIIWNWHFVVVVLLRCVI